MKHIRIFLLLLVLLGALLSGCSEGQAPKLSDVKQGICTSLGALRTATGDLANINPDTSVAELREVKGKLDTLVEAARTANTVLQSQPITDMMTAYDNFGARLVELNSEERVGDAAATLGASAGNITASLDRAYSSLSCQ